MRLRRVPNGRIPHDCGASTGLACIVALSLTLLGGCAELVLTEVTDENHAELTGPRFYMNRPFVVVHKPFPLASESFLVDAHVSPDGRHLRITSDLSSLHSLRGTTRQFRDGLTVQEIPTAAVIAAPSAGGGGIGTQGTGSAIDALTDAANDAVGPDSDGTAAPKPDATAGIRTGQTNIQIRTELSSLPHFPVNEHFSIVFLPDFDREMAVEATANAGLVRTSLKYGPGNMLLDLDADGDNHAITGPIMEAYDALTKVGVRAAKAAIAASSGIGVQGSTLAVAPAGSRLEVPDDAMGQAITLRMHVVRFAAVGLYPIVRGDEEVKRYAHHPADEFIVPRAPYEVPYRFFEVIVLEALLSEDVPSLLTTYSESAATFDGATPGGGGSDDGPSNRRPLSAAPLRGTPSAITTSVDARIRLKGLRVDSIVSRTPDRDDADLTAVTIRVRSRTGGAAEQSDIEQAETLLEGAFPGTTFDLTP